jgi:hypothetical protein
MTQKYQNFRCRVKRTGPKSRTLPNRKKSTLKSNNLHLMQKFSFPIFLSHFYNFPSEKLDDKILKKYVRQYIDDIFVEFGEQPSY